MLTRLALLTFFCAALLVIGVAPARAVGTSQSQPAISVTATASYGDTGAYIIGEWFPVRVTLTNPQGGQSKRVTVRIMASGTQTNATYDREVDLPSPSRKEITLYMYDGSYTRLFLVKLLEGDRELQTITVNAEPFEPPASMIVGVASPDTSLLNVLKGEQVGHIVEPLPSSYGYYGGNPPPSSGSGTATIAHITLSDIPTLSQALDSMGAIVLDDVDTGSLSNEQRAALEGWVARGGTLVATYRPGGADTIVGLGDLAPVSVSGSRTVSSLSGLADLVSVPITTTSAVAVGNAQLKGSQAAPSRVIASSDGTPLLVVRDLGQGQVVYLGLSPSLPPLKGWEGTLPLIKRILSEHDLRISYGASLRGSSSFNYIGLPGAGSIFETYGGLFALPGLDLPNPWLIGGFLLLYIIVIGPVNFIVLRRMKRAELAWLTIPVLVALFSGVAYALAFGSKGGELISIRANAIQSAEGTEQASLAQHFGLYSPARRTYRLDLNTDSVLTEINAYGYYPPGASANASPMLGGNGTTSVSNVNIDTWSLRGFLAQHTARLLSPLQADLHLGNNEIVGSLTNRTNGPLEDVALVRGRAVQYIGYMAPGETTEVSLDVSSGVFDNSSPTKLLPAPAGVSAPTSGGYYGGYSGSRNNQAQRLYDRKVEVLSAALYPFLSGEPPTDMSVTLVAWGPAPSTRFGVQGYSTSSEEVNVWAGTTQVKVAEGDQPILDTAAVPFTIYAPGNNPSVLPMGEAYSPNAFSNVQGFVGSMSGSSSQFQPIPTAVPTALATGQSGPASGFVVAPYADLQFRLPAGTKPAKLNLRYAAREVDQGDIVDLLAYNVATGQWDKVAAIEPGTPAEIPIPKPKQYTSGAGDITLRLFSTTQATIDGNFNLSLNSDE